MSTPIESLEIEIKANATKAAKGLDDLARSLDKIKRATKGGLGLEAASKQIKNLDSAAKSSINVLAKLQMAYNSLRTGAKIIGSAIKKTNDYIEDVNLFTVSMGEYASEARKYADQVGEIMGIDPGEWMRNQGVFMTLATGFGVVSDRAYTMSKNLTQLGYDLSSFFNLSYEDAMEKLQSGLAGELEPLRRIGYDLSQARLQQEAYTLGIQKKVSAMTQAEKAELRYHAIMTQVTTAQGDMARTLNAPANQLRVLSAQVTQAARAIGSIFIPVLNAVLPYLIAVAKVIRLVASTIASLFGFEMPDVDYSGMNSFASGAEGASDALGNAADNAKKLKNFTMGFDELNVIDPTSASGGSGGAGAGLGGSGFDFELPEYDFLDKIADSRVGQIVDEMKEWLGLTEEIDSWSEFFDTNLGQILITVGLIGAGIGAWKITTGLMTSIATFKKVLEGLGSMAKGFTITLGATIAITSLTINWKALYDAVKNGLDELNFTEILLSGGGIVLGGAIIGKALGSAVLGAAIGGIVAGIPAFFVGIYDACMKGLNWLNGLLIPAGATAAGAGIGAIIGMLGGPVTAGIGALIGLAVGALTDLTIVIVQNWEAIVTWFDKNVCIPVANFFKNLWAGITDIWNKSASWFDSNVIQPIVGFFGGLWDGISGGASTCWGAIVEFFTPAIDWFSQLFGSIFQTISDIFYNIGVIASGCWEIIKAVWGIVSEWFNTTIVQPVATFFEGLWNGISTAAATAWDEIKRVYNVVSDWFNTNLIQPVTTFFSGLWDGFLEGAKTAWDETKKVFSTVAEFFRTTFETAWQGIVNVFSIAGEIFVDIKDGIVTAFKTVVNAIIRGINKVVAIPFNGINKMLDILRNAEIAGIKPFGRLISINVPEIPLLASGGFVDTGQMFIAREAGAEMVGSIGRKTAVANNDQIVAGIASGVAEANTESNALLREQNSLLRELLSKETNVSIDGKSITKTVERVQRERGRTLVMGGAY